MSRALSVHSLLNKKYKTFQFSKPWKEAFGEPEQSGVWFIYGNSTNGKTSFLLQLCKELTHFGKVACLNLEEGDSKTFRDAVELVNFTRAEQKNIIFPLETIEELEARLLKHKSPKFVVIDSIQYTGWNIKKFLVFKSKFPNKLLIIVSQADGKKPLGRTAASVRYDADLKIWVEGFRAFSQGRYIGENGGEFDIWKEKALKHWGSIIQNQD